MPSVNVPKKDLIRWGILGGAGLVLLVILWVACARYSALTGEVTKLKTQVKEGEALLSHVSQLDPAELQREFATLNGRLESALRISDVLEELNHLGDAKNIDFVSVEPTILEDQSAVMIRMEMEGGYQDLGEFFGALDDMASALVRVKSLELKQLELGGPLHLTAEIELYMHQAGQQAA